MSLTSLLHRSPHIVLGDLNNITVAAATAAIAAASFAAVAAAAVVAAAAGSLMSAMLHEMLIYIVLEPMIRSCFYTITV